MLVVSADSFNASRISTVVCTTVTTNLRLADAPGNVLLEDGGLGIGEASVVNVSQVITLDKSDLGEPLGELSQDQMAIVESGLRMVLALDLQRP